MRRALLALTAAAIAVVVPVASAQAANPWIEKTRPLNIAHQGGEDEFPSNTMYAFRKARRAGADMLELDIGVTKDGKVIVMHDTTVDGKTNGHGTVASKTLGRSGGSTPRTGSPRAQPSTTATTLPPRAYRFRGVATGRKDAAQGLHGEATSACRRSPRC